jgi:hypothetical protein
MALAVTAQERVSPPRTLTWADTAPLHRELAARGITSDSFPALVDRIRQTNARRVRDGDFDHLVFYLLQSKRFAPQPIEPALSAKALVEALAPVAREAFLKGQGTAPAVPADVRTRIAAFVRAVESKDTADRRLVYFRALLQSTGIAALEREALLAREYLRVMRFVYEKEFVAQRAGPEAVAELYRTRGLSTDTAVESGYLVYFGLGIVRSLEPERRIRRVLLVGPGFDLAPRTALQESGPPQSYQPWTLIDALFSLGLATPGDLQVVAADINPRVVEHLRRPDLTTLTLTTEVSESATVTLASDFRDYFAQLGRALAVADRTAPPTIVNGHLRKTVAVSAPARQALTAETLDAVIERLAGPPFDLVVATNILPYFDDVELMLAMSNVAAMLAPGGVFLHNEARPIMDGFSTALGLPFEQSRHVVIADVKGAPPLFDRVFVHRKR